MGGTKKSRGRETNNNFLLGMDVDLDGVVDQEVHNCDKTLPMHDDGSLEEESGKFDALDATGSIQTNSGRETDPRSVATVLTTDNLDHVDYGGQGNNRDKLLSMCDERTEREEINGLILLEMEQNETRVKHWFVSDALGTNVDCMGQGIYNSVKRLTHSKTVNQHGWKTFVVGRGRAPRWMACCFLLLAFVFDGVVDAAFTPANSAALQTAVGTCDNTGHCVGGCLGEGTGDGACPLFAASKDATGHPYGAIGDWQTGNVTDMSQSK